jgi:hypothetical protein
MSRKRGLGAPTPTRRKAPATLRSRAAGRGLTSLLPPASIASAAPPRGISFAPACPSAWRWRSPATAIEKVLSLRTIYTGPEEVVVAAKIHPSANLNIEQLTSAMDDLDIRIRTALPIVADVFIDVTASRAEDKSRAP